MEKEDSFPPSQKAATYPNPEPDQSLPCPLPNSLRFIFILTSHLSLVLRGGYFFKVSWSKPCTLLFSPSWVLHALHISIFLIWSHENLCYGVQLMKLLIVQFCPISCSLGLLNFNTFLSVVVLFRILILQFCKYFVCLFDRIRVVVLY